MASQLTLRQTARYAEMESKSDHLRNNINAGKAVSTLNQVIRGDLEISQTRLAAIKLALGKVLPDLQAVAVAIENKTPINKHDVDALLLQAGLRPDMAWQAVDNKRVIDGEHDVIEADSSNRAHAPAHVAPTHDAPAHAPAREAQNEADADVWEEAPHPPESDG